MYKIWAHATLQENSASVCEIGFIINKKLPDTLSSLIMVLSQVHRKVCLSAYVCVCVCVCVSFQWDAIPPSTPPTLTQTLSNLLMMLSLKLLLSDQLRGRKAR